MTERTDTYGLLAEIERLTAERDAAQEHVAYHLRDFHPGADDQASGDLAVDMAAYAGRWRARAEIAERELAKLRSQIETEAQWLNAHHDGSLVTSDYPMIARRLRTHL